MSPSVRHLQNPSSNASRSASWITPEQWHGFDTTGTTAHRICSVDGAWVERLGRDLLFNHKTSELFASLTRDWNERSALFGFTPERIFSRTLPIQNAERTAPVLVSGDPSLPVETVVQESGIQYGLDFSAGYSVGLFLDQRANRTLLSKHAPRRVLNTFAYTCSFSVVAALNGAETVSADLSQKSLDRGKTNFKLNNIDPAAHRFIADDVQELLPRLARRKELFDAVILDPPTFSRGNKGRRFRAEDDLQGLLCAALEVAAPGGRVLLSTNCTRLRFTELETISRFALKNARRSGVLQRPPELIDFPPGTSASTLWIQLR